MSTPEVRDFLLDGGPGPGLPRLPGLARMRAMVGMPAPEMHAQELSRAGRIGGGRSG